jgi:dienelactone hydrolase
MKISVGLTAAAFLSLAGVCHAQAPAGVTLEMIATALPEEGAPKAIPGTYAVTAAPAFGNTGLKVFQPANLGRFPARDTLPVVVWGNGGCAIDNPRYDGFLTTIASHGFLVITTAAAGPPAAGPSAEGTRPPQATAANLTAAVDWAMGENVRSGSPLKGKIETKLVAVMGQSCGGVLAITLGADPRVGTIGVFNSGSTEAAALAKLHGPVLLINGHERDFMMARSRSTYDAIDKLPAFYGARHGAGHTATAYHAGGGEFANVATNWVRWYFKGDAKAGKMFDGPKCALCTDSNWDVEGKHLETPQASRNKPLNKDYRRVTRNGKELFCRREVMTGSRTSSSETCMTEAELAMSAERGQDAARRLQDYPGQQSTPSASGGVTIGAMGTR